MRAIVVRAAVLAVAAAGLAASFLVPRGFGTPRACEDVRVPRLRRPGPIGLALTAIEVWRRLPPEQRRQIMKATRKQAPRAAAAALKYWRGRAPRR